MFPQEITYVLFKQNAFSIQGPTSEGIISQMQHRDTYI